MMMPIASNSRSFIQIAIPVRRRSWGILWVKLFYASSIEPNMRFNPALALLLTLSLSSSAFAETDDFCRSNCFSEKSTCRKNAEQLRNDSGGASAAAAVLALALSARQPRQAEVQATNPQTNQRDEQTAQRNEGYLACDAKFSQCVDSCRR